MGRKRKEPSDKHLLDCRPIRLVECEEMPSGIVVLLRPRFMSGLAAKLLQPRLKKPHIRITLDRIGSFVWNRCDGEKTVREILEEMEDSLGHGAQSNGAETQGDNKKHSEEEENRAEMVKTPERLRLFLNQLVQNSMLRLDPPHH